MASTVHLVDFDDDDLSAPLGEMRRLEQHRDGWINVRPRPEDDPDEVLDEFAPTPVPSPLGIFTRRRPITVAGTWIPGGVGRKGPEPASVGLEHPAGRFAVRQLRDGGAPVPEHWKVVVDHTRRGLVLSVPQADDPDAEHERVLRWLLAASAVLAPDQVSHRWQAEVRIR